MAGTQSRQKATEGDEAAQATPVAHSEEQGGNQAQEATTGAGAGVTRRYRATHAVGRSRRGDVFDAADDDPRVLSGYVERLEDDAPDEVKAALEQ